MKTFQQGLTIIELLMSLAIIGILASVAVPSYSNMSAAQEVASAAEKLRQDLLFARSEAIKQNTNIHLSVTTGDNWCYGFTDTALSCACATQNSCQIQSSDKSVNASEYNNIALAMTGISLNDVYFTPTRGSVVRNNNIAITNGAIIVSKGANSATISLNILGHPSICSNSLSQFSNC